MAKRFGRNQRRKMREEIEDLKALCRFHLQEVYRTDDKRIALLREMESWHDRLARALHPDNALHRKIRDKKVRYRKPHTRVHVPTPLEVLPTPTARRQLPLTSEQKIERMYTYVLHIEAHPYDFSHLICWRELVDGKVWAYRVSDTAMDVCPPTREFFLYIAEELMKHFKADIARERAA